MTLTAKNMLPEDFGFLRVVLAIYFLLYAFIVAKGLIPLEEQAPRINALGLTCVVAGFVIAFHCLTSTYRLFLVAVLVFIPIAVHQINGRIRFLEMMLEPYTVETILKYSLYGVMLLFITPKMFKSFSTPASAYKKSQKLLLGKGIPY